MSECQLTEIHYVKMISTFGNFTMVLKPDNTLIHVSGQLHPNRAVIDGRMHVSATPNI